jgi:hypothetical protein
VTPHKPKPGEVLEQRPYLAAIRANLKAKIEAKGVRVTNAAIVSLSKEKEGEVLGLQMTLNSPEGQRVPLFPQDTFYTARQGLGGLMFDAHFTTYYRSEQEQTSLRATAHLLIAGFRTRGGDASVKKS